MKQPFIKALADPAQPIPGGGAAAAYAGSVALALFKKIAQVEMRRYKGVSGAPPWDDLLNQVIALDEKLYRLRDEDGESYLRLAQAKKSGSGKAEVASALRQAIDCPIRIMEQAYQALGCVSQTAEHFKRHLLSDLQVVCELLGAAGRGAHHIARANLSLISDPNVKAEYQNRLDRLHGLGCDALKLTEASILQSCDKS